MLTVRPIPAFNDNYIWSIELAGKREAFVVDPGDAAVVEEALSQNNLSLAGILITHHHQDHTGGIAELTRHRNIPVYGPANSSISGITQPLIEGEQISLGDTTFRVIATPGHTLDHIAFFADTEQPLLFCGDTLFAGGCGRLFEGTPEQMHQSLTKLAQLPSTTQVYCAHEYTLTNLRFCSAVEPENLDLQARVNADTERRHQQQPTVPSTLETELLTNPFLRCHEPSVITSAEAHSEGSLNSSADVLRVIRAWKDKF